MRHAPRIRRRPAPPQPRRSRQPTWPFSARTCVRDRGQSDASASTKQSSQSPPHELGKPSCGRAGVDDCADSGVDN
eukprot:2962629-Pyramimonas_sp.AAC.1